MKLYGFFKDGQLLTLHTNYGDIPCVFQKKGTGDLLKPKIKALNIRGVQLLEFEFTKVLENLDDKV